MLYYTKHLQVHLTSICRTLAELHLQAILRPLHHERSPQLEPNQKSPGALALTSDSARFTHCSVRDIPGFLDSRFEFPCALTGLAGKLSCLDRRSSVGGM